MILLSLLEKRFVVIKVCLFRKSLDFGVHVSLLYTAFLFFSFLIYIFWCLFCSFFYSTFNSLLVGFMVGTEFLAFLVCVQPYVHDLQNIIYRKSSKGRYTILVLLLLNNL